MIDRCLTDGCSNRTTHRSGTCKECRTQECPKCKKKFTLTTRSSRMCSKCEGNEYDPDAYARKNKRWD